MSNKIVFLICGIWARFAKPIFLFFVNRFFVSFQLKNVAFPVIADIVDKVELETPANVVPVNGMEYQPSYVPEYSDVYLNNIDGYQNNRTNGRDNGSNWRKQMEERILSTESRVAGCEDKILSQGKQLTAFENNTMEKMDQILKSITSGRDTSQNTEGRNSGNQRWQGRRYGSRQEYKPADRPCRICNQQAGDRYHHEKYCDNNRANRA